MCYIIHLIKLFLLKLNFIIHFFFSVCVQLRVCTSSLYFFGIASNVCIEEANQLFWGLTPLTYYEPRFSFIFSLWITINKIKLNNYIVRPRPSSSSSVEYHFQRILVSLSPGSYGLRKVITTKVRGLRVSDYAAILHVDAHYLIHFIYPI